MRARTANTGAASDLVEALRGVGIAAMPAEPTAEGLAVVELAPPRTSVAIAVPAAAPTPAAVRELVERTGSPTHEGRPVMPVLVADRISAAGRELLLAGGWGWLDRRGHLRLADPQGDLFIHTEIASLLGETHDPPDALQTGVGREVAVELLLDPSVEWNVRGLARVIARAPSSVSTALKSLREMSLVDDGNRPRAEALFDALRATWAPRSVSLATRPDVEVVAGIPRLEARLDDLDEEGWALTDTLAAAAWGAGVVVTDAYPPDLYVPDDRVARRAVERFGAAPTEQSRAARLLVAPVPQAVRRRHAGEPARAGGWPLAHPLFVALELARDPARGAEILASWTPKKVRRVW